MAITKLSNPNRFKVKVFMGWKDNGGRIDKTKIVYGSKREAQKVERELKILKDTGKVDRSTETLNQHAPKWLRSIRHKLEPHTLKQYESRLKPALILFGDKQLKKISLTDIENLFNGMFDSGLSHATAKYSHTVLQSCLSDAMLKGKISTNPMKRYKLPKNKKAKQPKAFNLHEVEHFLKAARASEHYLFYCLMLFAGLRPNEIAGLKWSCVELDNQLLRVEQTVNRVNSKQWSWGEPKTKNSKRTIAIGPFLSDLLCTHKLNSPQNSYDLVLTNDMLEPIDYLKISRSDFKPIKKRLGISDYPMYALRATHLTHFAEEASLQLTSKRAGHSSIEVTSNHYVSPQMDAERKAIQSFENKLLNSANNAPNQAL